MDADPLVKTLRQAFVQTLSSNPVSLSLLPRERKKEEERGVIFVKATTTTATSSRFFFLSLSLAHLIFFSSLLLLLLLSFNYRKTSNRPRHRSSSSRLTLAMPLRCSR